MSSDNDLKSIIVDMEIEMTSKEGKADLVTKAFGEFKKSLPGKVNGLIIYSRPVKVKILEETTKEYTERFLFIFLPRKRLEYNMKILIQSEVLYLDN